VQRVGLGLSRCAGVLDVGLEVARCRWWRVPDKADALKATGLRE
jgi:hypothetical protein